jgi:hypothetical protein
VLAALVSVALAAFGFARPRRLPGLVAITVAMALFGVPDVTGLMFVLNAGRRLNVVGPFGLVRRRRRSGRREA